MHSYLGSVSSMDCTLVARAFRARVAAGDPAHCVNSMSRERLWPARRLLLFASTVTLALNITEPLISGQSTTPRLIRLGRYC
ncbi:hypothetical protein EV192_104154 [Actinocrispum wychmicini]|uniref:Uncharacterized protein n=1 Tax=Actinocrispum wychmicini TaxID=1213861 RepID=A0A4R2JHI1_9PSEU|nr:hypothetical protein EV192_104154 [Actinocrispum wychmicini]